METTARLQQSAELHLAQLNRLRARVLHIAHIRDDIRDDIRDLITRHGEALAHTGFIEETLTASALNYLKVCARQLHVEINDLNQAITAEVQFIHHIEQQLAA